MSRPLKVYSWMSTRRDAPGPHHQTLEIVAARSMAEVGRIVDESPRSLFNLRETGNEGSIRQALSAPGVVFWRGINDWHGEWRAAASSLVTPGGENELS